MRALAAAARRGVSTIRVLAPLLPDGPAAFRHIIAFGAAADP